MPEPFSLGLSIPIMWAHCKFDRSFGCENSESNTSEIDIASCKGVETELNQPRVQVSSPWISYGKLFGLFFFLAKGPVTSSVV